MQRILIVEPDAGLRAELARALRGAGYLVELASDARAGCRRTVEVRFDLAIFDVTRAADLSRLQELVQSGRAPVVLASSASGSLELAVGAMKCGASDFLKKPFRIETLEAMIHQQLELGAGGGDGGDVVAEDPAMQRLLTETDAVARTEATVQIVGESGTGKDLLASRIHRVSRRSDGPYVVVNCVALPRNLAESELFGHERGAFTGAVEARSGQILGANGGTLVFDEVGDTAPELQPKLLRVLQEREVLQIGAAWPRPVDVRVIATAQRDLLEFVSEGRFREDLYYRLDVVVLRIPPLRERRGDIPALAQRFLDAFARGAGSDPPQLGEAVLGALCEQPFPGNVRELENLMRRAVVLFPGTAIDIDRLLARPGRSLPVPALDDGSLNLRELERRAILRSLAVTGGNRTHASRALGISVRTLRNKIRTYGLSAQA